MNESKESPSRSRQALPSSSRRTLRLAAAVVALLVSASLHASAQTFKLESGWQLLVDKDGTLKVSDTGGASGWRDARVGLSWNAQFADLRDYMGVAWYRTKFDRPELSGGRRALLRFGACDYFAEVFVNGKSVGTHEGGYTPFTFDVTDALRAGANELVVRVVDPPMDEREGRARFPEMLYDEIPHGKQDWYVQTGGLWQGVTLDVKPADYITGVKVVAKSDGRVSVEVASNTHLGPPPPAPPPGGAPATRIPQQTILDRISVRVVDSSGKSFQLRLTGGGGVAENDYVFFEGRVPEPQLWSLDYPNLYTVEVALGDDRVTDRFGFRTFEAREGKLYLNGEPFYMRAALDQDFYPETIYTPPSKEYVREQMLKGKQMGLNVLRCHIKVCTPEYLEAADEVGMMVWYEIPSWNSEHHFSEKAAGRGEQTFREMVARDWNHPSIVIQSVVNEGWGVDLAHSEETRRWLRAAFDRAKQLTAPLGRVVVDNSACCDNFHLKTDITDNHRYNTIPDEYRPFDAWVDDFASRPKWNFSPFGDADETGREPLVVSEFGNWGLPKLPKSLPWWFDRGFGDRPITRPAGLFDRFKEFKFGTLFRDYDALAEATEWHQFVSLKHEIEAIRLHYSIQGYVITEFTDINWEANGLMNMWREPKAYAAELAKIQQDDIVLAPTDKHNYTSREPIKVEALLSHYGGRDLQGAQLSMWLDGSPKPDGRPITQQIESGSVTMLSTFVLTAPVVARPERRRIMLEVRDAAGRLVAENYAEIFVYPKAAPATRISIVFHDPKQLLKLKAEQLTAAGYPVSNESAGTPTDNSARLMIASSLDDEVGRFLRAGGRVLLLADSKNAMPAGSPLKVTPRAGSDLDGNWISNFNWVRDSAPSPFARVAFTKILGFESERVVPRFVMEGVRGENYDDVLSGITYGWLNSNEALAVQARAGRGRLLATTFRFDDYGQDPYATQLLDALAAYASGPDIKPRLNF
ncbi:MAG TPA: glycoside hydrolase family 2 TIM barrel-domain containing protein [Pyrinomonadaceae bacterium]|nr:glycoside hydrolase family 2 TIM barrel-domain containing protein [Pyrinomonadaceae bacterium]